MLTFLLLASLARATAAVCASPRAMRMIADVVQRARDHDLLEEVDALRREPQLLGEQLALAPRDVDLGAQPDELDEHGHGVVEPGRGREVVDGPEVEAHAGQHRHVHAGHVDPVEVLSPSSRTYVSQVRAAW